MPIELIAEDGGQRKHRAYLRNLLDTTGGSVRVASAYVTDDDLLFGVENRAVRLLTSLVKMDIVSGATKLPCLRTLVESGVKCRCLSGGPRLHAKVYIFGDESAVVTSANLTTNAFESNIEVGVEVTGSVLQGLITWFDTFWKKADPLDLPMLFKLEKETESLRRAYAKLRRKAGTKQKLPIESMPSVRSPSELRDLIENAPKFFVCNTNRRYTPDGEDEDLMRRTKNAIVWTSFKYPEHMKRVLPGHAIFMFAKRKGIIAVARATGKCKVLPVGHPERLSLDRTNDEEWHVPVDDWLFWAENDDEAYEWNMRNRSFLDVSGDGHGYPELREGLRERFSDEH
jgi:hypothetical protein